MLADPTWCTDTLQGHAWYWQTQPTLFPEHFAFSLESQLPIFFILCNKMVGEVCAWNCFACSSRKNWQKGVFVVSATPWNLSSQGFCPPRYISIYNRILLAFSCCHLHNLNSNLFSNILGLRIFRWNSNKELRTVKIQVREIYSENCASLALQTYSKVKTPFT